MRNSSRLRNDCKLLSGLDVREVSTFHIVDPQKIHRNGRKESLPRVSTKVLF